MHKPRNARIVGLLLSLSVLGLSAAYADETPAARLPGSPDEVEGAANLREEVRRMIAAARDKVFPALVNIHVVTVNYSGGKERKGASVGSGTIISKEGYVVTNYHVTANGRKFRVTLTDRREVSATMVGEDALTDLAVLKMNLKELDDAGSTLPVAHFGDSSRIEVGDYVMAMGSPFALSRSVTLGIISNPDRVFSSAAGDELDVMTLDEGETTGLFTNWIQHDANINPGNSGGPLVNLAGEVIGVNELGGSSMGFAIPCNLARQVADDLIAHGEVPRSQVGVSFKPIKRSGFDHGVLVNSVTKGGPADEAGVQAGDLIVAFDGKPLTVRFAEEIPPLLKRIASMPIGSKLKLDYERAGQKAAIEITTGKMEREKGQEAAFRGWGMTAREITVPLAREERLDTTDGAMITSIRSGGPGQLAEPPLAWGDVLKSVDGEPIRNLDGFISIYRRIMRTDPLPEYVLIEFERDGESQLTLLKPRPEEDVDPPREVRKAWIGVATQPVLKQLSEKLGLNGRTGFRITRVYPGTNAARTDLKVGDIIVGLNGDKLAPRGMQDAGLLAREVRRLEIDDEARLAVLRGNEEKDVAVVLEGTKLTPAEARRERNRDFELTVREVTFFDRDENKWSGDVKGVLAEQVEGAGWAGLGGISPGDLIQRIAGQDVPDLDTYRKVMKKIAEEQPERVEFVVLRGVRTHFQFVEPDWNPVSGEQKSAQKE